MGWLLVALGEEGNNLRLGWELERQCRGEPSSAAWAPRCRRSWRAARRLDHCNLRCRGWG